MQSKQVKVRLNSIERVLRDQVLFNKAVLTLVEAHRYLGITKKELSELVSLRVIPFHIKLGRIYFKRAELDSWLMDGDQKRSVIFDAIIKYIPKLIPWITTVMSFLQHADSGL